LRKSAQIGLCDAEIRPAAEIIFRSLQASVGRARTARGKFAGTWRFATPSMRALKKRWKKAVSYNVVARAPAARACVTDSIGASNARGLRDRLGRGPKIIPPKC
jgi:hypothetical protein